MNDITDPQPKKQEASSSIRKDEAPASPPTEAEFERFAEILSRDLRRAHTAEITCAAKTHFHPDNPDIGGEDHDRRGTALLEELGKRHTREQFTFRASIGKLRTYYAAERGREPSDGPSRSDSGMNKATDRGLSR